jgi:hypothetical protein
MLAGLPACGDPMESIQAMAPPAEVVLAGKIDQPVISLRRERMAAHAFHTTTEQDDARVDLITDTVARFALYRRQLDTDRMAAMLFYARGASCRCKG